MLTDLLIKALFRCYAELQLNRQRHFICKMFIRRGIFCVVLLSSLVCLAAPNNVKGSRKIKLAHNNSKTNGELFVHHIISNTQLAFDSEREPETLETFK